MVVSALRRRFTVEDFHRMAEAGILTEDDRVELLDGEIVEMTPIGSRHAACVDRLNRLLTLAVRDRAIVRVQNPVRLSRHSEPEPDLALLTPRPDFYAQEHPGPEAVLLVVEVADTSLDADRTVKLPLYARAGVPVVWLVGLAEGWVEAHEAPTPEGYRTTRRLQPGERLALAGLPGLDLAVSEVFGTA